MAEGVSRGNVGVTVSGVEIAWQIALFEESNLHLKSVGISVDISFAIAVFVSFAIIELVGC
jgi:hypothetical protein